MPVGPFWGHRAQWARMANMGEGGLQQFDFKYFFGKKWHNKSKMV